MKLYTEGYKLGTDEYLLKIDDRKHRKIPVGFLSKFTQKGAIPEAFKNWGKLYNESDSSLKVYVFTETHNTGWKLSAWRFGMSENWASLIHPSGFTLEIYLQQFLEIIQTHTIINGEIQGSFKWESNRLVEQP